MRSDMGRVVIERPRTGSSNRSLKARRVGRIYLGEDGYDYDGPGRVPNSNRMHAICPKIGDKGFTDLLGPIKGYLQSSIGRKWDDVYSEIARNLGAFSWPLQHIVRDHIDVETNTYLGVDGKVYAENKYGNTCVSDGFGYRYVEFYVHPITRVLCVSRRKKSPPAKPDRSETDRVKIDAVRWYVFIKGLWFIGTYRKSEFLGIIKQTRFRTTYGGVEWPDYQTGYGRNAGAYIFTVIKQANKKEIKRLRELQNNARKDLVHRRGNL